MVALMHHRQGQAAIDPPSLHDHRAGAALAMVTALLGAGQVQMLAQRIEQGGAGIELQMHLAAVHGQSYGVHAGLLLLALRAARGGSMVPRSSRSEEHTSELQSLMRISY